MNIVVDRNLRAKETILGHPLDPEQVLKVFTAKSVDNFRYLALAPWNLKDVEKLDTYWRQGHTLHAHVDRCMKTEDVACQIMKNDHENLTTHGGYN